MSCHPRIRASTATPASECCTTTNTVRRSATFRPTSSMTEMPLCRQLRKRAGQYMAKRSANFQIFSAIKLPFNLAMTLSGNMIKTSGKDLQVSSLHFLRQECPYVGNYVNGQHGVSQQGVWVSFWTPKPLKSTSQDTPIFFEEFLKMSISSI